MASRDKVKPNIILIMSDDQGAWAMGCAGNHEIRTPHIDQLAKSGVLFENFFCVSPVCSPARASVFTGKIPSQHGVHDWIKGGHISQDELSEDLSQYLNKDEKDMPSEYRWPIKQFAEKDAINYLEGHTTFTEILHEKGYRCGISGKWHLGDSANPQAGFTYWKTTALGGEGCYYHPIVIEDGQAKMKNQYITDYITDNAITYINECAKDNNPFYLSVHYTAPHAPWGKKCHPEHTYSSYDNCTYDTIPFEELPSWFRPKKKRSAEEEQAIRQEHLQGYFTAVTAMDDNIGRIMDSLKEHALIEDTLIIFTSDNGMSMGHHGIYGKGNGTFPLNMYDTAVKVPMIISRPGHISADRVEDSLLSHYDIMPTILDYLGYSKEVDGELPGRSFVPILEGRRMDEHEDVVIMDEYGPTRMIRTKEWKYIHRYPYGPHELYDLVNDVDEKVNLINDPNREVIKRDLRQRLESWFMKYVIPECDGKGEGVTGAGQLCLVGPRSRGREAFN